jgi:hypothetical protein
MLKRVDFLHIVLSSHIILSSAVIPKITATSENTDVAITSLLAEELDRWLCSRLAILSFSSD